MAPGGVGINTKLQHMFGGRRDFDRHLADKVDDWALSMNYLSDVNFDLSGARLMEIGTGWHPALPICFALAEVGSITTFDITRLLDEPLTLRMLDGLQKHVPQLAELVGDTPAAVDALLLELRQLRNLNEILHQARIEYRAPADACYTDLADDSIDLVYSNSVLEHVPRKVIGSLMKESFRVLKPGGLAMHNIGCNDHYAFFDKSISFVNFLQYDEREWKLWNNPIQYQNRLRAPEFLDLAKEAGFEVIKTATNVRPGTLEALSSLRIAPQFSRFTVDEMAITTLDFISRKPAG